MPGIPGLEEIPLEKRTISPGDEIIYLSPYEKYKLVLGTGNGFFIQPRQLDTTRPSDLEPKYKCDYKDQEGVSSEKLLKHCKDKDGKSPLRNNVTNVWGIIPEITQRGNRRCCYVHPNGQRCMASGPDGVCKFHRGKIDMDLIPYKLNNQTLKDAYKQHLNDPNRKSLDQEVALMRACLSMIMDNMQDVKLQEAALILQITEKIAATVDRMSKIETRLKMRLTPEEVMRLVSSVIDSVVRLFKPSPDQLKVLADQVEGMMTITTVDVTTEPPPHVQTHTTVLTRYRPDGSTYQISKKQYIQEQIIKQRAVVSNNPNPRNREEAAKTLKRLELEYELMTNPHINRDVPEDVEAEVVEGTSVPL